VCPDNVNLRVLADNPVLIGMDCDDTGPPYERSPVREFPTTNPTNGTLGPFQIGDPSVVSYTPNRASRARTPSSSAASTSSASAPIRVP